MYLMSWDIALYVTYNHCQLYNINRENTEHVLANVRLYLAKIR